MDWKGQVRAEFVMRIILVVFGVIGLLLGWTLGDVSIVFKVSLAGCLLGMLVVVPDWPCWNQAALKWQAKQQTATQ
jgi:hypothetical protein